MRILWLLFILVTLLPLQAFSSATKDIALTDQDKAWIAQHPIVNFTGDPDWLPFEAFTKDGRYIGIIPEFLKIFEQQTSIKFNIVPTKTWSESVSLLEKGKVDMLTVSDAWKDPNYLYTKTLLPNPIVIVMQDDHMYIDTLYYLQYESIAVIKGYRYIDNIRKKYPDYSFYEVENIQEGLEGVAAGKYDALLASMALATYTIEKMQLNNVKVVGKTEFEIKVAFAVRKEFAPLVEIINKIRIGEKRGHELLKEWTYQKYVEKTDYSLITKLFMLLLIILMAAVILYLLYKKKSRAHEGTENVLSDTQEEIDNAIKYASILDDPSKLKSNYLNDFFDDSFNLSHPKNIKSSTLAHFRILNDNQAILMVIDPKGEGVDSILNALFIKTLLKRTIAQLENGSLTPDPAEILSSLGTQLRQTLGTIGDKKKPGNIGFDAAIISTDKASDTLTYAGANIPLFYTQNHKIATIRADKKSIDSKTHKYTNHSINISGTMDFYLVTRGYMEQTGGKQNLPFGKRRTKEILEKYENYNMDVQKNALVKAFMEHKGKDPRVGDITLVGLRATQQ
ncbi:MAG: transporter substrate-binding domain-containing protein [Campylobacterota bacterium]|nr:transporter substrate-binding domain-containing protein [Campylobacterota bacterium]